MKKSDIYDRIKQNRLDQIAGDYFVSCESDFIKEFNSAGKKAILGIRRYDGIYTLLGQNSVYYLTTGGTEGELSYPIFHRILKDNALSIGKKGDFEFVKINEVDSVWLLDGPTMSALWNTILFLEKQP